MTEEKITRSVVDSCGRIPMPVLLRTDLGFEPGSKVYWVKDDARLHLRKFADVIKDVQSYFRSLSPTEDIWSDDLIRQRKEEGQR